VKQVQQNYRSGELKVAEVPAPALGSGELLIATRVSLISSGTERQLMQLAKSSLVGKAAARPDLVRRVLVNARKEGLKPTFDKVFAKLDTPIPLGYSPATASPAQARPPLTTPRSMRGPRTSAPPCRRAWTTRTRVS
jgi:hypothetical protein